MKICFILFITCFPLLLFLSDLLTPSICNTFTGMDPQGGWRAQFVSRKYWFASSPVVMYCPFWVLFLFDFLSLSLSLLFCPHLFMFARHLYITRLRNSTALSSRHPEYKYLHNFLMCFAEACRLMGQHLRNVPRPSVGNLHLFREEEVLGAGKVKTHKFLL